MGNVCNAALNAAREIRKEYTPILEYSHTVVKVPRIYYLLYNEIGKRMAKYDEAWALYCALDEKRAALCQEIVEDICKPISRGHVA